MLWACPAGGNRVGRHPRRLVEAREQFLVQHLAAEPVLHHRQAAGHERCRERGAVPCVVAAKYRAGLGAFFEGGDPYSPSGCRKAPFRGDSAAVGKRRNAALAVRRDHGYDMGLQGGFEHGQAGIERRRGGFQPASDTVRLRAFAFVAMVVAGRDDQNCPPVRCSLGQGLDGRVVERPEGLVQIVLHQSPDGEAHIDEIGRCRQGGELLRQPIDPIVHIRYADSHIILVRIGPAEGDCAHFETVDSPGDAVEVQVREFLDLAARNVGRERLVAPRDDDTRHRRAVFLVGTGRAALRNEVRIELPVSVVDAVVDYRDAGAVSGRSSRAVALRDPLIGGAGVHCREAPCPPVFAVAGIFVGRIVHTGPGRARTGSAAAGSSRATSATSAATGRQCRQTARCCQAQCHRRHRHHHDYRPSQWQ